MHVLQRKNRERPGKFAEVKVTGYVGKFNKPFCSDEHIKEYQRGMKEISKRKSGSCCG